MKIGILALQGAFLEHKQILDKINIDSFYIRNKKDLEEDMDGIIIPGGESTVMSKLLDDFDMKDSLKNKVKEGLFTFGTCAGLILLSDNIVGSDTHNMKLMNIEIVRNAYGRQLSSFVSNSNFNNEKIKMVFIRGPYIKNVASNVEVLSVVDDKIVAAREKNILVTAFHPELTDDTTVHKYFINMIKNNK